MNQNEKTGTGQTTRQRGQRSNNRNTLTVRIENREFTDEKFELSAVLGLLTKRLNNSVPFDKFQDKIKNYVLKNFKKADDIIELIVESKDLTVLLSQNTCQRS